VSEIQILMVGVTLFFIYKIYEYIQNVDEDTPAPGRSRTQIQKGPSADELVKKADTAFEYGDTGRALNFLEDAAELEPDNAEIAGKLAFMLVQNGQDDKAVENYRHAISLDKDNDLFHSALASLYRKKGMPDEARQHYDKALAIDPDYEVTYYNYGNLLQDMGHNDEAITMYQKATELNPDFAEARAELEKLSAEG